MAERSNTDVTSLSPATRIGGQDCTLSRGKHQGKLPVTGAKKGPSIPLGFKETHIDKTLTVSFDIVCCIY